MRRLSALSPPKASNDCCGLEPTSLRAESSAKPLWLAKPISQAGAVGPFPEQAGAAAALAGFVLAAVAFGIGLWLGAALDGTVRPLAYGVGLWSLLTCAVAWTLVRRLGRS